MKRMLFNATQAEELRVAIVDGQKLVDLDIESASKEQRKGNIYKGIITRVEPSLEACFVDYGTERHGFLPFKEISRAALGSGDMRGRVHDNIKEGMELIVQVEKDERGHKGAALTNFISLAGRYLVLMPNNPRGGGVSRRIEGEERNELRDALAQLEVPGGMSLIGRTAGIGRAVEELQWDLNYLLQLWTAIDGAAKGQKGAFLIYAESSLVIRAIRDYFTPDIGELLIDTPAIFEQAKQFMAHVMPGNVGKVKLYADSVPLFSRFQIEHQIETAYSREVPLPSGGALVIDHTEALVAIDVNSAQATRGADIEQTAFNTNLEAAEEVARQMRLRDLGGLIVIDFIDMENQKNQREVEDRLRDSLHHDRARIQVGKISRFGLMEMSRQRLQPSLGETSYVTCPRCSGTGHVRSTESFALHLLRMLQEEAMKENTGALHIQAPVEVATYLLNEKRTDILNIEARHKVELVLIPNIHFETPKYTLARLRHDQLNQVEVVAASYQMMERPAEEEVTGTAAQKPERAQPMVQGITPSQPAPTPSAPAATAPAEAKPGLFGRIMGWLRGMNTEAPATQEEKKTETKRDAKDSRRGREAREGRDSRRGRGERGERGERSERGERQEGRKETEARGSRGGEARAGKPERGERQPRGERTERSERGERQERPERQPRGERAERGERSERPERSERGERQEQRPRRSPIPANPDAVEVQANIPSQVEEVAEDMAQAGETQRRGRRRGRGRRGEGRSEEAAAIAAETVSELIAESSEPASETLLPVPVEAAPVAAVSVEAVPAETAPFVAAPVEAAAAEAMTAVAEAAAPVAEAEAVAEAVPAQAIEAPKPVEPVTLPEADLASAGLELVETHGAETAATETAVESNPSGQRRRRRVPKQEDTAAEPLMLVETAGSPAAAEPVAEPVA
ncbi:MAG: Rne/Rng family ribonuclease, partial [Thiobacillus sp.]|nr:Rne/Rng family ribonuclease [Thiobacillus sp.]